jgi:molybdopterin converting factor small subunit
MIDVLYFAWVRERIGLPRERVETQAATVADLVAELRAREDRYAAAFADLGSCAWRWIRSWPISTRPWRACARWPSFRR